MESDLVFDVLSSEYILVTSSSLRIYLVLVALFVPCFSCKIDLTSLLTALHFFVQQMEYGECLTRFSY